MAASCSLGSSRTDSGKTRVALFAKLDNSSALHLAWDFQHSFSEAPISGFRISPAQQQIAALLWRPSGSVCFASGLGKQRTRPRSTALEAFLYQDCDLSLARAHSPRSLSFFHSFFLSLSMFETESHSEHRLASNLQQSPCLSLTSARIVVIHHPVQLEIHF